jgi:hypothetical protein
MKLCPRVVTYRRYGLLKNNRSERLDKSTSTEKSDASSSSLRSLMESKVVSTEEEDSDCLFIAETEEGNSPEGGKEEESESASVEGEKHPITPNPTFHKLPISELKTRLAFCTLCSVQYVNHKQANLCLAKHGKRQCWLCLDVIPNTKDAYLQHCVRVHKIEQNNDIVSCPYCKKSFDFRQGFNQHIVKVHFSEDTSYVTNTASLSPNSLVTLYTGQPRPSQLSPSTVTNPENPSNLTTTCNNSGGDIYRGNIGGHYTAVSTSTSSSLTISPVLLSSFFRDPLHVIPETNLLGREKGKLNYDQHHQQQQPSFGLEVDKELGIVKDGGRVTRERESVIRETPQPNNMTFNEMYGIPQQQHPFPNHNQPSFIEERGAGNEIPGNNYCFHFPFMLKTLWVYSSFDYFFLFQVTIIPKVSCPITNPEILVTLLQKIIKPTTSKLPPWNNTHLELMEQTLGFRPLEEADIICQHYVTRAIISPSRDRLRPLAQILTPMDRMAPHPE